MSQKWSGSRFASRQTGFGAQLPSRVPAFQPPSYYAAAAGLSPRLDTTSTTEHVSESTAQYQPAQGVPLSYPTAEMDIGEVDESRGSSHRKRSLSRSFSRATPKGHKDQESRVRDGNRRQMAEIPFLETQLLPSLRDTIDKMTHPPRQVGLDDEPVHGHEQDNGDKHQEDFRTLVVSQDKHMGRSPVISPGYTPALAATSRPHPHSTPVTPALGTSSNILNTPSASRPEKSSLSKATSKIPGSSRVPTKSNLRMDPPANSSVPNTPLLSPHPEYAPENSLRSARSIALVSQSPGMSPASCMRSPVAPSPGSSKMPQASGSRSRTQTATPRNPDYPRAPVGYPSSSLPRPKEYTDSGSELEREYGKRYAAGRLVVANAEVAPSSSESEHDDARHSRFRVDDDRLRTKTRIPRTPKELDSHKSPRIQQRSPAIPTSLRAGAMREDHRARNVGLGFQGYAEMEPTRPRAITPDDGPSVYDSDQPEVYSKPKVARRLSRQTQPDPYGVSEGPGWGRREDQDRLPRDEDSTESTSGKRRREALIGLVNGLQFDAALPTRQREKKAATRNGDRRERYVQEATDPRVAPDRCDLENHDEVHTVQEDRRYSKIGKERDRQHTVTQSSRLPTNSQPKAQDLDYVERRSSRDHRRSISLPPKDQASSKYDEVYRVDVPQRDDHEGFDNEDGPEVRSKRSRHRSSTSVSQTSTRRRSGVDMPANSASAQRSKLDRRSSSQATETISSRSKRKSDTVARERAAFGIPDSLSYVGYDVPEPVAGTSSRTSPRNHVDDYSVSDDDPRALITCATPDGERWEQQDTGGFSSAAQALFNQLSDTTGSRALDDSRPSRDPSRRSSGGQRFPMVHARTRFSQHLPDARHSAPRHDGTFSASSSAPSMYEVDTDDHGHQDSQPQELAPHLDQAAESWRSTLRPATYDALLSTYGQAEMDRQALIFRLYMTHSDFVRKLRSVVKIFVVPLRRKHSKVWLPGVPKKVSNLFDWLEDILNLHRSLDDTLRSTTEPWQTGDIVTNIAQVLRGFVPRLEIYQPYLVRVEDIQHILANSVSSGDEFGQFIQLRQTHEECEHKNLEELLMLPVQYLYSTVDTYKELWQATPPAHCDHLASLSLFQSMRMIVHVMHEVKSREEEYDFVKDMSGRVEGLLPSVQLARRERRLLWHGEMICLSTSAAIANGKNSQGHWPAVLSPPLNSRSGSHRTPAIVLSPCPNSPSLDDHDRKSSKNLDRGDACRPSAMNVAVFTDIVLLTEVVSKNGRTSQRLFVEAGVSKVLTISAKRSPDTPGSAPNMLLGLLPISQSDLQSGAMPEGSSVIEVRLAFPTAQDTWKKTEESAWSALHRCRAYTLSSLSFPSHSGQYLPHGSQVDLELDTQKSVMDILNTGLPLPKSPSVQFKDNQRLGTREGSDTDREREERGWWTLRFQQVLRELQRQDPMLSLAMFEDE